MLQVELFGNSERSSRLAFFFAVTEEKIMQHSSLFFNLIKVVWLTLGLIFYVGALNAAREVLIDLLEVVYRPLAW